MTDSYGLSGVPNVTPPTTIDDQPSATSLPGSADNDVAGPRPSAAECLRRKLLPFPVLTTIVKLQLTAINLGNGCLALAESLASWGCTTTWRPPAEQSLPQLPLRDVVLSENDISDVCDFALSFFAMGDAAAFYDVLPHRGGVAQAMVSRQPSRAPVLRLREFSVWFWSCALARCDRAPASRLVRCGP